jgi:mannose-6-phosphate isomerase
MSENKLYPLKFEPIYQYRIWGGRRLSGLLTKPLPVHDPVGEAWILSDRDDHPSKVTGGKLKGHTINQLLEHSPKQLMGKLAGKFKRFPLLLKFLDCKEVLSVQVHPSDQLKKYIPKGDTGKTESWVVLEKGDDAVIYAGLKPGTTEEKLRASLEKNKVAEDLAHFKPKLGDSVLIKAGTVHTLGDVVVFEVQENSDSTYRLYDWDRVDKKTGKPRDLQVEEAIACIDFDKTAIKPVKPDIETMEPALREKLIEDEHFNMWRLTGTEIFKVGQEDAPRVLVCIEGEGKLESDKEHYSLSKGEVMLLPAILGICNFTPKGKVILLDIELPGE